ncbi:uncharacterized protein PAC_19176 [Phialocephala subalpina]|uniref:Uncharacterized protein n=1 Tax=Phialocephala subalpina TaxID=576137 RepID=A0A1L7XW79_9HELO|nr:uncharacterized protein PAC_19176 [Phialocephala subalpina]
MLCMLGKMSRRRRRPPVPAASNLKPTPKPVTQRRPAHLASPPLPGTFNAGRPSTSSRRTATKSVVQLLPLPSVTRGLNLVQWATILSASTDCVNSIHEEVIDSKLPTCECR